MTDAYSLMMVQASEKKRSDAERERFLYQALRMLCDDVVGIRECPTGRLSSMQRAVIVVDEACEGFGFHCARRQPFLEFVMWAEAKTRIAPFQRVDDVMRTVESLAELRVGRGECIPELVVIDNPYVSAEYIVAELPVGGRSAGFYQLAKNEMNDLEDTPDPEAMRRVRRARRQLVRTGRLLTATAFSKRAGFSHNELRRRVRRGVVVRVRIDRANYYSDVFLGRERTQHRLAQVTSAMKPLGEPWLALFELSYRFDSLETKTLVQVMRRGAGYRAALRYARAIGASHDVFGEKPCLPRPPTLR